MNVVPGWSLLKAAAALAVLCFGVRAQAQQKAEPAASACWRFAFGEWSPPLDWSRAGHPGDAGRTAATIRRIRDSVYVKDSAAAGNNAMTWERTEHGLLLLLYPMWWPAGVEVRFDSTFAGGKEMVGTAVAMVADASQEASHTRAHAWQVNCGGNDGA